jgi:hypothetical protein
VVSGFVPPERGREFPEPEKVEPREILTTLLRTRIEEIDSF